MGVLQQTIAELGFKVDTKNLDKAKTGIGKLAASWQIFAGVIAAGAALRGLGVFLSDMALAGDKTDKLGQSLGLTARQVGEWEDALGRAGGEVEQFGDSYKTFAKFVEAARKGGEDQQKGLRRLGVSLRDSKGRLRETSEVYEDAVLGLGKMESATRRAALADEVFGSAGMALIRVGQAGKEGLDAQREAFDKLYGGNYERYIQSSKEQLAAQDDLGASFTALKRGIAAALLPAMTWLTVQARKVVEWFTRMTSQTKIFETALIVFGAIAVAIGVAITIAFIKPILIFLAVAAIIAAVILVVEDLWQLFTGGKSAIGGAMDALFGVGTAKKYVEMVTGAVKTLWSWIKSVGSAFMATGRFLTGFGEAIGDVLFDADQATLRWMSSIEEAFGRLWTWLKDAGAAVTDSLHKAFKAVSDAIDSVIGPMRDLYDGAKDLLGLGDDEDSPRTVRPNIVPEIGRAARQRFVPRELPIGATGMRPGIAAPRAANQLRVDQPVQINVNGASDPGAVGAAVQKAIEEHSRSGLEFARDLILGIP